MRTVPAIIAKDTIARLLLPRSGSEEQLGQIRLRRHQREGVDRILLSLHKYRGALLCDEVGLGKTFTAAAVMQQFTSAVVIAPSGLLAMWRDALEQAAIQSMLISLEKFSRARLAPGNADLIVVDEAHHLRNPVTRRFRNVASYAGASRLLLMTATPVHNRRSEITTLISLFLGSRAKALSPLEFSECVIRRRASSAEMFALPNRAHVSDECPPGSESIRRQILGLPPPVPPRDGDYCATLVQFTLLRQWASSDAALKSGLEARMAKAYALISALESGTYPTRKELSAWLVGGGDIQLGFSAMLAKPGGDRELLDAVRQHATAVTELHRTLGRGKSSDEWRAAYLRHLRAAYPDRKIIAFTQFASTARSLFKRIKADSRVAVITASGCEIASGPVSRKYVIERFAPIGSGVAAPLLREEILMVISTDLCSEGLNLQDAGVVVHLDIPWTPARLEQRVGRIARHGSAHSEVMIHTLNIPVIADDLLRMAERLRGKSAIAHAMASVPDTAEKLLGTLESWKRQSLATHADADLLVGIVGANRDCFLGIVGDGSRNILIGGDSETVTNDPMKILACVDSLSTTDIAVSDEAVREIAGSINRWLEQQRLESSLGVTSVGAVSRRQLTRRINKVTATLPSHLRAAASLQADRARRAMAMDYGAAAEERIAKLAHSQSPGDAWFDEISTIDESSHNAKAESFHGSGFQIRALLIGRKPTSG